MEFEIVDIHGNGFSRHMLSLWYLFCLFYFKYGIWQM